MTVEARTAGARAPGGRALAPPAVASRADWWVYPATVFVGLGAFAIYSAWSIAFASGGNHWHVGPYLSPFYSPLFQPGWWPLSPALLVFWAPLGFRATCYYYRKAYYRGFFWDPPACAIREPRHGRYGGETRFPFILNNFHRYFLYLALVVLAILWFDAVNAFSYRGVFYLGLGSVLMLLNVILLTGYTFSCHALRHLVGGNVDCFSCVRFGRTRHRLWRAVSAINPIHGNWAWASLISVVAVDVYIRLVSAGVFGSGCFGSHTGC